MIKSIVVKTKPFELKIGDVIYSGDGPYQKRYVVIGPPENPHGIWKVPAKKRLVNFHGEYVEREDFFFPGDEGMPGFTYDNRPCKAARSSLAASANVEAYWTWLDHRNSSRREYNK